MSFVKNISKIRITGIFLILHLSPLLTAGTYYVATTGNDSNSGTISKPWLTWQKAFHTAQAGDTVYIRGGIYAMFPTHGHGIAYNPAGGLGFDGTESNPIVYMAYPGEKPILDGSNVSSPSFTYLYTTMMTGVDWVEFHKLQFRNFKQPSSSHVVQGIQMENCTNIKWIECVAHDFGGVGWLVVGPSKVKYINCDAYNCCDSLGHMPGNYGSGFSSTTSEYTGHIEYIGCRAWNCSDQGFGTQGQKSLVSFKSCWSFNNGAMTTGGGHGFKLGYMNSDNVSSTDWVYATLFNCIAAFNREDGFTSNDNGHPAQRLILYNNIAYHNGHDPSYTANRTGFNFYVGTGTRTRVLKNNISYDNFAGDRFTGPIEHSNNSWDTQGITVNQNDFVSLDSTGLAGPRQNDGSLPNINFLKLASTSDLINIGTNVGLPYNGSAPDLGWHESSYDTNTPPAPSTPVYVSSVIQNTTPARLEMTYNLTLANIIPATSAFAVSVNNVTRNITSVAISGTKVLLTLASPVVYVDAVTVAYTKPTSNPLQTTAGGQAATIAVQNVTNNVAAINPVYVSSVIQNATPARLEITYNLTLASILPATSAFAVRVNSVTRNVTSVTVSGTKVLLTLASPIVYDDAVTVAYIKPASYPLQTDAGGQVATIAAQNVINNVGLVNQPPIVTISSPTKSTSFIAPATITIDAVASDPDGYISKVEFYQGSVKIGELVSATGYSFVWKDVPVGTYSLTAAAIDNLGLRKVSTAVSVTVEKSASTTNQRPAVSITLANNKKPKKHENVIMLVEASDPDGTISKVELKSGDVSIAELTSAPYIFTLTDVDTGSYEVQALAFDNLGAVSNSAILRFFVENSIDYNPDMISLYPNPNDGNFNIEILSDSPLQDWILSIVNLSGQPFYKEIINGDSFNTEVNLQEIPSAVYVVILSNGKTILSTKKFIKS